MKRLLNFDNFLGNRRVVEILKRAIEQDRLPHAMIFAGPSGVGKCTLALLVAQYLNCIAPLSGQACGTCSVCKRIAAVLESRHLECQSLKGEGYCGSCANCRIRMGSHPDIRIIEPQKSTITIDQVRDLIREIAFQPLEARFRVVILDPADQMRIEAQNSLLKTLEEPPSRTIMILVTTNPYILLETIRSRSRLLQFGEISQDKIEQRLLQDERIPAEEARLAAALSGGSLTVALDFDTSEYREVRKEALQFVTMLLRRGKFAEVSAAAMTAAKDKKYFQLWMESVSVILQDVYYASISTERVGQKDLLGTIEQLARSVPHSVLVTAIGAMRKLKNELQFNVNRQLALEAMFLSLAQGTGLTLNREL
jgi:DNA polymerase-3 subunit delta'